MISILMFLVSHFYSKIESLAIFLLVVLNTGLENCTKSVLEMTDFLITTEHATKKDRCLKC